MALPRDGSQMKIRDRATEEGKSWSSGAGMSIQTESPNKSITHSSDADEYATAIKRAKISSDGNSVASHISMIFIIKYWTNQITTRAFVMTLRVQTLVLSYFWRTHRTILFLRELFAELLTILLISLLVPAAKFLKIVMRTYRKRMDETPNDFKTHVEELKNNDPFVVELCYRDHAFRHMVCEYNNGWIDKVSCMIDGALEDKTAAFANPDEARRLIKEILSEVEVGYREDVALAVLIKTGSKEEAIAFIKSHPLNSWS